MAASARSLPLNGWEVIGTSPSPGRMCSSPGAPAGRNGAGSASRLRHRAPSTANIRCPTGKCRPGFPRHRRPSGGATSTLLPHFDFRWVCTPLPACTEASKGNQPESPACNQCSYRCTAHPCTRARIRRRAARIPELDSRSCRTASSRCLALRPLRRSLLRPRQLRPRHRSSSLRRSPRSCSCWSKRPAPSQLRQATPHPACPVLSCPSFGPFTEGYGPRPRVLTAPRGFLFPYTLRFHGANAGGQVARSASAPSAASAASSSPPPWTTGGGVG